MSGVISDNQGRASGLVKAISAGRTGTVDWDTSIKTGTVTAVTGKGYFVDTTSGGITVNLPTAAVGSIVAVSDYASTSASNNITIAPNGSEKIGGIAEDATLNVDGQAATFVYVDGTNYPIKQGDFVLIPPNADHYFENTGESVLSRVTFNPLESEEHLG